LFHQKIMKTSLTAALFLSGLIAGYSQTTPSTPNHSPAETAYRVVHRSANQSVWQRETYEMSPDGRAVPKIHQYVEVASGLNYLDSNGVWKASEEWIESYPGGAIARLGQTKVIFANNLDSFGAIDVETPDHKRLRSNILGLMLHDLASDKAVLIAQVQDSQGQLISSNQVLYVDAFDGVSADVRYTYHKGSFHQDVILKGQLPSPTLYGMDPATTEVEVMTEFVDAPEATVSTNQADEQVSWGALRLGRGVHLTWDRARTTGLEHRSRRNM
jgi:hypothetical protein